VFENKVLRKILWPMRVEVTEYWRKLYSQELHDLYSPSIIWVIKSMCSTLVGIVAHMEEKRNACRILVGKPEQKGPLLRPRHRWEDSIKMALREREW
jgi:hypothetical protein